MKPGLATTSRASIISLYASPPILNPLYNHHPELSANRIAIATYRFGLYRNPVSIFDSGVEL